MRLSLWTNIFLLQSWVTGLEPPSAPSVKQSSPTALPTPCRRKAGARGEISFGESIHHRRSAASVPIQPCNEDGSPYHDPTVTPAPIPLPSRNLERTERRGGIGIREGIRIQKRPRSNNKGNQGNNGGGNGGGIGIGGGNGGGNGGGDGGDNGNGNGNNGGHNGNNGDTNGPPPGRGRGPKNRKQSTLVLKFPDGFTTSDGFTVSMPLTELDKPTSKDPSTREDSPTTSSQQATTTKEPTTSTSTPSSTTTETTSTESSDSTTYTTSTSSSTSTTSASSTTPTTSSSTTSTTATTPTQTSPPLATETPKKPNNPDKASIAAGSVLGGFVVLSVAFLGVLFYKRWRGHKQVDSQSQSPNYLAVSSSDSGDSQGEKPEQHAHSTSNYPHNGNNTNRFTWHPNTSSVPILQNPPPASNQEDSQPQTPNIIPRPKSSRFYASIPSNDETQQFPFLPNSTTIDLPQNPHNQQRRPLSMLETPYHQRQPPGTYNSNRPDRRRSLERKPLPSTVVLPTQLPTVAELPPDHPPSTPPSADSISSAPSGSRSNYGYGPRGASRSTVSPVNPSGNRHGSQYSPVSSISPVDTSLAGPAYEFVKPDNQPLMQSALLPWQTQPMARSDVYGVPPYSGT
ncbi:hypothetical protein PRK78_007082 [Emydomyces testavorans]|uniref:Mid2 domain-containing protein n=1 Tax=Emydomyces testavorans TaxID=2070801 RepID=A0AAF0DMK7_9EURO|nr:hypothetical protein PRK78_007082 [Emydomyces testavorans]